MSDDSHSNAAYERHFKLEGDVAPETEGLVQKRSQAVIKINAG